MKKILFVSHDTSRTGAPMVLLHFLKWLQINKPEIQTDVLTLRGGSLDNEFKNVATNFYDYYQITQHQGLSLLLRFVKKSFKSDLFISKLVKNKYDIIYANTIVSIPLAAELMKRSVKTNLIVHIHEMNTVIRHLLPNFSDYIKYASQFITPSEIVKSNLIDNWNVPKNKISVAYECASINKKELESKVDNTFTIGASGTAHWRKGHDVFIQVARYLCDVKPNNNFRFVWVGRVSPMERIIIEEDILKLRLKHKIFFVGELEEPNEYYAEFDIFLMTSREDPFPLVCLELGLIGRPIITFEKATGTNEVLSGAGGFVVPYLNIEAMSEKVLEYYENPTLVKKHGDLNKEVFSKFTPDEICPQYFKVIQNFI